MLAPAAQSIQAFTGMERRFALAKVSEVAAPNSFEERIGATVDAMARLVERAPRTAPSLMTRAVRTDAEALFRRYRSCLLPLIQKGDAGGERED